MAAAAALGDFSKAGIEWRSLLRQTLLSVRWEVVEEGPRKASRLICDEVLLRRGE